MNVQQFDFIIVGSGFYGSVMAERIASQNNKRVLVIDKRPHIGGNSYSEIDKETGIEYHKYGTHIFHTKNQKVWDYIQNFTSFNHYKHHVFSYYNGKIYNFPINLKTIQDFYNIHLSPYEVQDFLAKEIKKEFKNSPKNMEEKAINLIGRPLYEAFIYGYTIKQWSKEPKNLPEDIINRLPIRDNYNDNYFFDLYQGIPLHGYKFLFEKLLENPNIHIQLNVDWKDIRNNVLEDQNVIFTGPIDEFFDYKYGRLEYRSLSFEYERKSVNDYLGNSVINYPEITYPYTRIHEFKHLHPERTNLMSSSVTLIAKEFSKIAEKGDEMYYPVNTSNNIKIFDEYYQHALKLKNIHIAGRLGSYRYLDMDQVISLALEDFEKKYQLF